MQSIDQLVDKYFSLTETYNRKSAPSSQIQAGTSGISAASVIQQEMQVTLQAISTKSRVIVRNRGISAAPDLFKLLAQHSDDKPSVLNVIYNINAGVNLAVYQRVAEGLDTLPQALKSFDSLLHDKGYNIPTLDDYRIAQDIEETAVYNQRQKLIAVKDLLSNPSSREHILSALNQNPPSRLSIDTAEVFLNYPEAVKSIVLPDLSIGWHGLGHRLTSILREAGAIDSTEKWMEKAATLSPFVALQNAEALKECGFESAVKIAAKNTRGEVGPSALSPTSALAFGLTPPPTPSHSVTGSRKMKV